ncbi:unnamed protein product [Arabidopsis halleri]
MRTIQLFRNIRNQKFRILWVRFGSVFRVRFLCPGLAATMSGFCI